MLVLKAKKRKELGKKVRKLRKHDILPAVLYGPKVKSLSIQIDLKDFENIYKETGATSLFSLEIDDKKFSVLIHEIKKDPLSGEPIHVDFYQPILTEKVEAIVPIVFEGEAPAVKELGGTFIREIQEIEVKALPQNLPHEIKVNIENLKSFEDEILVKDLKVPENVKIQREPNEIIANVARPETEKIEKELEKPIEEAEIKEGEEPAADQPEAEKGEPSESSPDDQVGKKDEEK